jgi:hypothetical protein
VNKLRDLIPELMNPSQVRKVDVHVRLTERRAVSPPATVNSTVMLDAGGGGAPRPVASINGRRPRDVVDAYAALLRLRPEDTCQIAFGAGQGVRVKATAVPLPDVVVQTRHRLGMTVEQLTPLRAERFHLDADDALVVTEVLRGGAAASAGLRPGDVIVQVGRYRVSTLDDFAALVGRLPESGRARLYVIRDGEIGQTLLEW